MDLAGARQRLVGVDHRSLGDVTVGDRLVGRQVGDLLAADGARLPRDQLGHERPGPQRHEHPLALGLGVGVDRGGPVDGLGGVGERGLRLAVGHLAPLDRLGQLGATGVVAPLAVQRGPLGQQGDRRLGLGHGRHRLCVAVGATAAGAVGRRHVGRQLGHPRRGHQPVEQREAVGRLGRGGLGRHHSGVELVEQWALGGQALVERGQRGHTLGRGDACLGRGARQALELADRQVHPTAGHGGPGASRGGDPVVQAQVEQLDQQVLPAAGLVVQEPGELALRQGDTRREVVEREPEQGGHRVGDLVGGAGEHLTGALEPGLLRGGAAGLGRPHDARRRVGLPADGEVEPNARLGQVLADDRRHGPPIVEPRDRAVEREREGVDRAGLARTGGTDEGEQVGAREVDHRRRAEDGEALDLEADGPHAGPLTLPADTPAAAPVSSGSAVTCSTSSSNRGTSRSSATSCSARYSANRSRRCAAEAVGVGRPAAVAGLARGEHHLDGRRDALADLVGQARPRRLVEHDAQVVGPRRLGSTAGTAGTVGGLGPRRRQIGRRGQDVDERAPQRAQPAAGRQRDRADDRGLPRPDVDDVDRRLVGRLAEVELQRRPAVVQRRRARELLRAVQVAQRHVLGRGREGGGGDPVVEHRVGAPLAAAHRAAHDHQVGGDQVHGAGSEPFGEDPQDAEHPVGVGRVGVGRVARQQHVGGDDVALRRERQQGEQRHVVARRHLEHATVVGWADGRGHRDAAGLGERGHRRQAGRRVVVAGEDHHRAAAGGEVEQGPVHDALGLGRGRGGVEQVAGHDHEVDVLALGHAGDLGEDGAVLVRTGTAHGWPCPRASRRCGAPSSRHHPPPQPVGKPAKGSSARTDAPFTAPAEPLRDASPSSASSAPARRRPAWTPPRPSAWPRPGTGTARRGGPAARAARRAWCPA